MFSKSCRYAIRAVFFLAVHTDETRLLGTTEIADQLEVPKPFLAKILQQLSRHQLISSRKGAGGGFFLNTENRQMTLREVIECIDGKEVFKSCVLGLPVCSSENPCPLHEKVFSYRKSMEKLIDDQQVDDISKRILAQGLTI